MDSADRASIQGLVRAVIDDEQLRLRQDLQPLVEPAFRQRFTEGRDEAAAVAETMSRGGQAEQVELRRLRHFPLSE